MIQPSTMRSLAIVCAVAFATHSTCAQNTNSKAVASDATHVVSSGESLYGLVNLHYPSEMNRWSEIAADIVALNPEAFPQGLDTIMKLGTVLRLPAYLEKTKQNSNSTSSTQSNTAIDTPTGNSKPFEPARGPLPESISEPASEPAATTPNPTSTTVSRSTTSSEPSSDLSSSLDVTNNDDTPSTRTSEASATTLKIGTVTNIMGDLNAISTTQERRKIKINEAVYLGDALLSGDDSVASIRMIDDAVFYLRPNTRILFEQYDYTSQSSHGRSVLTLLNGGFRAISGQLGKNQPSNVSVNTAVATINAHGTDYGLKVCGKNSCYDETQSKLSDGLYSGVLDGTIAIANNTGEILANKGDVYFIAGPDATPTAAPRAATALFTTDELEAIEPVLDRAPSEDKPLGFWRWLKRWLFG